MIPLILWTDGTNVAPSLSSTGNSILLGWRCPSGCLGLNAQTYRLQYMPQGKVTGTCSHQAELGAPAKRHTAKNSSQIINTE